MAARVAWQLRPRARPPGFPARAPRLCGRKRAPPGLPARAARYAWLTRCRCRRRLFGAVCSTCSRLRTTKTSTSSSSTWKQTCTQARTRRSLRTACGRKAAREPIGCPAPCAHHRRRVARSDSRQHPGGCSQAVHHVSVVQMCARPWQLRCRVMALVCSRVCRTSQASSTCTAASCCTATSSPAICC